jgi:hypothetical protein
VVVVVVVPRSASVTRRLRDTDRLTRAPSRRAASSASRTSSEASVDTTSAEVDAAPLKRAVRSGTDNRPLHNSNGTTRRLLRAFAAARTPPFLLADVRSE